MKLFIEPPMIPRCKQYDLNDLVLQVVPFDLGFVIGRLASDGCVSMDQKAPRVFWCIAPKEMDIKDTITDALSIFNLRSRVTDHGVVRLLLNSKVLANQAFDSRLKKQCPESFCQNDLLLRGWAQGMFDGDGSIVCRETGPEITCTNVEIGLVRSLGGILDHFGIPHSIRSYEDYRQPQYKMRYNIFVHRVGHKKFAQLIGFRSRYKVERLKSYE